MAARCGCALCSRVVLASCRTSPVLARQTSREVGQVRSYRPGPSCSKPDYAYPGIEDILIVIYLLLKEDFEIFE